MNKSIIDKEIEFIEVFKKNKDSHPAIREFECQRIQLLNDIIPAGKKENIVGATTNPYNSFSGFSESDYGGYYLKLFDIERQYHNFTPEEKKKLDTIKGFWENKTTFDKLRNSYDPVEKLFHDLDVADSATRIGGAVPNFQRLLKEGLIGFIKRINNKIEESKGKNNQIFYYTLFKACKLIGHIAKIYSNQVALLAEEEEIKSEKQRLKKVSNILKEICSKPPNSFHAALQLVWLIVITGRFYDLGRFDQYLFSFYKKDIDNGNLTKEEAHDLLKEFWIKFHELGSGMYEFEEGKDTPYLSQIGKINLAGIKPSGESGVNDLTYLCLEVTRELKFENPSIIVRWFESIPRKLMNLCFTMLKEGVSNPAFFNDNIGIELIRNKNIPLKAARDYILTDCGDISVDGRSYAGPDGAVIPIKCLDMALHNGKLGGHDFQCGPETGDVSLFKTFEDLINAYFKQVEFTFSKMKSMVDKADYIRKKEAVYLFRSLLLDDCIESGKGLFEGGVRYNWLTCELHSMTNVHDSLAAIKKVVYEDKKMSLKELVRILDINFKGFEDIRQVLINKAPKFGNDDEYVDEIAERVLKHLVALSEKYKIKYRKDGCVVENISTNVHIIQASQTNPSPDGRKYGMPFASSIGSTAGMDKQGPSSVLKSVSKLTRNISNGASVLNISFDSSFFNSTELMDKIIDFVETYFKFGGAQIQIIINSRDILIDAQKHPDKYPNLLVRVGGFSAIFLDLSEETQNEIINRTFHA